MTRLQFSVSDEKARVLKELAAERGLSVDELLDHMTDEFIRRQSVEYNDISKGILTKNKELYRRFAK